MDLIDRYLQAVKFWLPKQQKQDIIAELSEDIQAQIEERESGLGRKLNEADVSALLKERGRPVLVANRYQPQEHLIGPVLFPIYIFVLKIVALCYVVPWVLVWVGLSIYNPGFQAQRDWGTLWGGLWTATFVSMGVVTIVFAVLERAQAKSHFLENWDPLKLPPVRQPNQIPRSTSIIELVVNLMVAIWWVGNMSNPIVWNHPPVRITLSPLWSYFFWGMWVLTLVNAALAAANLVRPYRTRVRATIRLIADVAGSALFCWLMKANVLTGIAMPNIPPAKALEITNAVNWWMAKMFPAWLILSVVIAAVNVFKLVCAKPAKVGPAQQVTAMTA